MRIVLVRPRDPNNIGAAARAMANFGLEDLAVVDVWDPSWREAKAAVGASHVLEEARAFATLDEAIGDCQFVVATTAATRRRFVRGMDPDAAFASMVEKGIEPSRTAILFGNEKHGLTSEELDRAHAIVVIPTSFRQPSLNLSQAVALMAWEAWRILGVRADDAQPSVPMKGEERATVGEIERLVAVAIGSESGRRELPRPEAAATRLRRLLMRSNPSAADIQLLFALFNSASDNDLHE
ncbi:MAG: RNA methyltransferase [Blastocatellia bacterium]|nr:RNA methyltransferase [Blastocatellia bacterium]